MAIGARCRPWGWGVFADRGLAGRKLGVRAAQDHSQVVGQQLYPCQTNIPNRRAQEDAPDLIWLKNFFRSA